MRKYLKRHVAWYLAKTEMLISLVSHNMCSISIYWINSCINKCQVEINIQPLAMEFRNEFNESTSSFLNRDKKNMAHSMFFIIFWFEKKEKILPEPLEDPTAHPVCPSHVNFYSRFKSGSHFVEIKKASLAQDKKRGGQCLVSHGPQCRVSCRQRLSGGAPLARRVSQLRVRELPRNRGCTGHSYITQGAVCSPAKADISRQPDLYTGCAASWDPPSSMPC